MNEELKANTLFEVSWEVCNKVGGIYTVISTKALSMNQIYGDRYFLIGPDILSDDKSNTDFMPDESLFVEWKEQAAKEGLSVKTGRWNIEGKPKVILIDFYQFISEKDAIFSRFWEQYKLDSISGQWDYIEPALFGYAAGRLIESFSNFNPGYQKNIIAQFHEWMTGAGVLYLKKSAPYIGTVFTTHATVLGRSLAGNNRPLYKNMKEYNPYQIAREFNITSKQSLESLAAQQADAFTTVSEITANECSHFLNKPVDLVTPNGFNDSFVPVNLVEKRNNARKILLKIAGYLHNETYNSASFLVAISGRYEFKNKGLDVFIKGLAKLAEQQNFQEPVVAFILIPADHTGPAENVQKYLQGKLDSNPESNLTTHNLRHPESDPIIHTLNQTGLNNEKKHPVKVVFVPSYLNGNDGIFNLPYYDLLIGFDMSIFPSYYEPWGYTPLESLAFHVPTLTTNLAGFGLWVKNNYKVKDNGIMVLERTDDNDVEIISGIAEGIFRLYNLTTEERERAREEAFLISRIALWENLVPFYTEAYKKALFKVNGRFKTQSFPLPRPPKLSILPLPKANLPLWVPLYVDNKIPARLHALVELANNLWWVWNQDVEELWESLDAHYWETCGHNPNLLLEQLNYKELQKLETDKTFLSRLDNVFSRFKSYINTPAKKDEPSIAYFSMEFGFHDTLKIFSGGLGILAGDYLKEASDENKNIIGIGLLYRYGYFKQILSINGDQQENYVAEQFSKLPVTPVKDENGNIITISIAFPGRNLTAAIWEVKIGRISLYLLDTDLNENQERDRSITHHLYGGDHENRLKQELLLGVGGIWALKSMGLQPDLYHSNEGHSAFIGLERINMLITEKNLSFSEAKEYVRATTLFTTHTPVPAGHDSFDENLMRTYIAHYPEKLKISWEELMQLGKAGSSEKFNMSYLAANLSSEINGVSKLHGKISRVLLQDLWPGYLPEESPIGYVTNGVHFDTWASNDWKKFLKEKIGQDVVNINPDMAQWQQIKKIEDSELWKFKQNAKRRLFNYIRERFTENGTKRFESPKNIMEINQKLDEKSLTIGFARRFATYKRAELIFKDLERLKSIINHSTKPVQFIFAGKAHPKDQAGKDLIHRIFEISRSEEFQGKILFLQNYDIELARKMVQGVDIWLNTPTRPLEASGTSGEKAVMNGTIHFSVLDGWWLEGYRTGAGWALPEERTYHNQDYQDELDAEMIYNILETEIVPVYYDRNQKGVPEQWVQIIKENLISIAPAFTMKRMMNDYFNRFYSKLYKQGQVLKANDMEKARMLAYWKYRIISGWNQIEVLSKDLDTTSNATILVGNKYFGKIEIDLKDILPEWVSVELVVTDKDPQGENILVYKQKFELEKHEETRATFSVHIMPTIPGYFNYGIRIVPVHPELSNSNNCKLVKWI